MVCDSELEEPCTSPESKSTSSFHNLFQRSTSELDDSPTGVSACRSVSWLEGLGELLHNVRPTKRSLQFLFHSLGRLLVFGAVLTLIILISHADGKEDSQSVLAFFMKCVFPFTVFLM